MRCLEYLLVAGLVVSCAPRGNVTGAEERTSMRPREYHRALERYTTQDRVYRDLETRLLVTATYRARSLRTTFVDYHASLALLDPPERDKRLREEMRQWEIYHEVVFQAYTPVRQYMDFEQTESVWRLYLYDSAGNRTEPAVVERLDRAEKALKIFYPYTETAYGRTYSAKFPREALEVDTRTLTFQIAGPLGLAEMTFDRRGEPEPDPAPKGSDIRVSSED